ncbi:MAG: histidine ammonia-lyase [Deltaproteobacteria bacterium]|nr:histidine ammonia-lyase [Deltaproteobacteria bacterium]
MPLLELGSLNLGLLELLEGHHNRYPLSIEPEAKKRVLKSREIVEQIAKPTYGINTGLGSLKDRTIPSDQLTELSHNTLRSHACGFGKPLAEEISRWMLLLRIHTLALGYSGVRLALIEKLIELYEKNIFGVVYEHGSVGSSGDLVPLAHIALPLLGEGEVWNDGSIRPAAGVLQEKQVRRFELKAKEGLSLINGTQMMLAHGLLLWERGEKLWRSANTIAALSLEALRGSQKAFHPFLHERRPIPELQETARFLWNLLEGSEILKSHENCERVQDAYSLRCIPQVHGTYLMALNNLKRVLECEIRSSTDNPLVSVDSGEILSGGNFHGEPIGWAIDSFSITMTKLSSISERRINRMVDPTLSGLSPFLIEKSGLQSGMMISQYTAASIVSENKVLAHPATADSIPTAAGQEDINSMGSIAAKKGMRILENTEQVLAIELVVALQALDLSLKDQQSLKSSPPLSRIRKICRKEIPVLSEDRYLRPDLERALTLLRSGKIA